ncbi:MAG: macro domain-containing protein [bacterium]|nr:macro domain-containing protein [bacterium]
MEWRVNQTTIKFFQGDITTFTTDAIVNAANNHLWMGGGVAGAIKQAGGRIIEEEAIRLGPIPIGEAVVTTAGNLKAKYVIHAAGMGQDLQTDADKIRQATRNSLLRACQYRLSSIAFPAIGTGVGGFPARAAAEVMLHEVVEHCQQETTLREIDFVLYDASTYMVFLQVAEQFLQKKRKKL